MGWGSYVRLLLRPRHCALGVGGVGAVTFASDCVTVGSYVRLLLRDHATASWAGEGGN